MCLLYTIGPIYQYLIKILSWDLKKACGRLISQILYFDDNLSRFPRLSSGLTILVVSTAPTLRRGCSQTSGSGKASVFASPFGDCCRWDCKRFTSRPLSFDFRSRTRLCGSLIPSIRESFPVPFGTVDTSPDIKAGYSQLSSGSEFTLRPLLSAVWTFLQVPDGTR